jgi:glycosyltransferase involved in cell wall biosynthesis
MAAKDPLVSVVIPVYNCERYLEVALDSIINQTYKNLEVIVIDDGSKDKSWKIMQAFAKKDKRVHAFRNKENLKIVGTLNFGVAQSKGKYIARMDGDDRRELDSIEKQVIFMESHPDVVVVGGAIDVCDSKLRPINRRPYPETDAEVRSKLFRYSPFAHPAIMLRASVLGPDPYQNNWAEDYELYFRLGQKGKFANLNSKVLNLRTHRASVSQSKLDYQEKLTLFLRLKAVFEYGYMMSRSDKLYFAAQLLSKYLMPSHFRFWLFNKLRSGRT